MPKRGVIPFILILILLVLTSSLLLVSAASKPVCTPPNIRVSTPEGEVWAQRMQEKLAENDITLRIERTAPFEVPKPHYQSRAEVSREQLEAARRALEESIAEIERTAKMPAAVVKEAVKVPLVRDEAIIRANVAKLAEPRFEQPVEGVKRYQLWVNRETGEVAAVGRFDDVREIATDPSHINIVMVETFGKVETPVNLEKYLSPRARQVLLDTMADFERKVPDVVASAPPPKALEEILVTRLDIVTKPERPTAKAAEEIGIAETLPDIIHEEPTRIRPSPILEPDAAPTNKGYASRHEILDDVKPFTGWLEQQRTAWAVSGSGSIADELAAAGQRTGDADILIPSRRWQSLDAELQRRAAAGTLDELGIEKYNPMTFDRMCPTQAICYESTAKGSVVLKNGQDVDLIAGFGYRVDDAAAIQRGFIDVAGIRVPVELNPVGDGYRAVLFDLDEAGRPMIPEFFRSGEDGRQFMTLDGLHAKYSLEKRADRLAFVEELQKHAKAALLQKATPSIASPEIFEANRALISQRIGDKAMRNLYIEQGLRGLSKKLVCVPVPK